VGLRFSTQIPRQSLAFCQCVEHRFLNAVCMVVQAHVLQHHDTTQQQSRRVCETFSSDIWRGAVHGLEDRALISNVAGRGETKASDQPRAHVGQDITVQVRHNQDFIVVWCGVSDDLEAGIIEQLRVELDLWELLADVPCRPKEQSVGHLHDGGLVDSSDLALANIFCVLESELQHSLGSCPSDELDTLHDTVNHYVLDSRVLSFRILTDQYDVHIIVWGLVAGNRATRSYICEKIECSTKSKIERDVAFANRRLYQ